MSDVTNVKVGPCSVTFNSVDVGHTIGGIEVVYSPQYKDIKVDKYGESIVEKVQTGEGLMVKCKLAESVYANIQNAIPLGTLAAATRLTIGKEAGARLSSVAHELVLHPLENGAGDLSDDIVLYKAVIVNEVTIPYKYDEERVLEVEFFALVDESKSDGAILGLIGDSTA